MPIRLAIIGFGKIARDEHVPAIVANPDFELVAVAGPGADLGPVRGFASHTAMLANVKGLDAVAICTPPMVRYGIARDCLVQGLHVLLEKPPAVTLGQVDELEKMARTAKLSLFAAWHARHNKAVVAAAALLSGKRLQSLEIEWSEDVRQWHPNQSWIWSPGGFGVFDAGINAISIATMISPAPLLVEQSQFVIPANMQTPIAASLAFSGDGGLGKFRATFDWRATRSPATTIQVRTEDGTELALRSGGASLYVDQRPVMVGGNTEYYQIYGRFAHLIQSGLCDVDREPLRVIADAFLVAQRTAGDPFTV